jgi:hypothetical protein
MDGHRSRLRSNYRVGIPIPREIFTPEEDLTVRVTGFTTYLLSNNRDIPIGWMMTTLAIDRFGQVV